jgi:hypothetical protein
VPDGAQDSAHTGTNPDIAPPGPGAGSDGDVRVWPSWSSGAEVVFIGLTSPDGEALLQAPTRDLVDFLGRTYALCPQGQERDHLDVDGAIEALLAS